MEVSRTAQRGYSAKLGEDRSRARAFGTRHEASRIDASIRRCWRPIVESFKRTWKAEGREGRSRCCGRNQDFVCTVLQDYQGLSYVLKFPYAMALDVPHPTSRGVEMTSLSREGLARVQPWPPRNATSRIIQPPFSRACQVSALG